MNVDAPRLLVRRREYDRFLAEHESGGAAEKMRADDSAADRHRARAVDDGDGVAAGVGHRCFAGAGEITPRSFQSLR